MADIATKTPELAWFSPRLAFVMAGESGGA
jgi:hypothetical protein